MRSIVTSHDDPLRPGAGTHPATANESQKIYFATSHDLNTWTKTSAVFETDTSLYTVAEGAWDCLATIPASAAAAAAAAAPPTKSMVAVDKRHGIITAVSGTPTAALEKDNAAAVDDESLYGYFFARSKANNGGGFAHSRDGIHWTALQSVHSQPASSVFQFEDRIWLTAVITLAGPAKSPLGPFGNGGSINDGGRLVSMGFLRAWTINAALVLLTHQHVDNGINGASSYIGVIKQVKDDPDQVPRCWWWPQNNALYGRDLYVGTNQICFCKQMCRPSTCARAPPPAPLAHTYTRARSRSLSPPSSTLSESGYFSCHERVHGLFRSLRCGCASPMILMILIAAAGYIGLFCTAVRVQVLDPTAGAE